MTFKLFQPTARPASDPQGPVSADPSPQTWAALPAAGPPMAQVLSPQVSATSSLPEPEAQPPTLAAIRAFRRLAGLWQLDMADQLALLGLRETQKATYYRWLREAKAGTGSLQLDRDQMARISHLLAIFEALGQLFQVPEQADGWVRRPNNHPVFQGRPPLERLARGGMEDLIAVRAYVEGAREGLV